MSIILCLYQMYLKANAKLIYMPIIQDDYFITLALTLSILFAILATAFWGVLGDKKGAAFSYLFLVIADTIFKIFMNFSSSKTTLMIGFILIGIT